MRNLRDEQASFDRPEFDRLAQAIKEGVVMQLAGIVVEDLKREETKRPELHDGIMVSSPI